MPCFFLAHQALRGKLAFGEQRRATSGAVRIRGQNMNPTFAEQALAPVFRLRPEAASQAA